MVLALVNRKGGVGKTTLAVNIAACLARQGQAVLLVDADPQGSATAWAGVRGAEAAPPFQVISLPRSNLGPDVAQLSRNFSWTLLDGPPAGAEIARACIAAADRVLLPVEPSALSAWAADLTVEQVQAAQSFKPDLLAWFVVTRKIPGTVIGREMRHLIAQTGIPVLTTEITHRVAFAESLTVGQSICEYAPRSAGTAEIKALTQEILQHGQPE